MNLLTFYIEFFGAAVMIVLLGWIIGFLLKLDKKYEEMQGIKNDSEKKKLHS